MNWDAIGAIGEIVGATAVFVSLIYLAIQIRTSNRASQQSSVREVQELLNGFFAQIGSSHEVTAVWARGNLDAEDLAALEKVQYRALVSQCVVIFERMYRLEVANEVDSWIWTGSISVFRQVINSPGFRSWFDDRKQYLNKDWAQYLEHELSQIEGEYSPQGVTIELSNVSTTET